MNGKVGETHLLVCRLTAIGLAEGHCLVEEHNPPIFGTTLEMEGFMDDQHRHNIRQAWDILWNGEDPEWELCGHQHCNNFVNRATSYVHPEHLPHLIQLSAIGQQYVS